MQRESRCAKVELVNSRGEDVVGRERERSAESRKLGRVAKLNGKVEVAPIILGRNDVTCLIGKQRARKQSTGMSGSYWTSFVAILRISDLRGIVLVE